MKVQESAERVPLAKTDEKRFRMLRGVTRKIGAVPVQDKSYWKKC